MVDYKFEQKVKVAVTEDLSIALQETLEMNQWSKPLIVIDSFLIDTPIIKNLFKDFNDTGISYHVYDKVIPEPPMEIIDNGAEFFKENNCDCIIAIGGGSVIDSARGINIVRVNGGKICEYVMDKQVEKRCHGLIAIPTTSGTGSELSNALVVTDTKRNQKLAVLADEAVSEYVILDPHLTASMPKGLTVQTGLDVFAHAAEAYTSNLSSPVVDAICEKVMFLVMKYLPKAANDGSDLEARQRMMIAATLGGWVINNGGTHLGHSIGHIVGAQYHIPHGMACAYALPGVLLHIASVESKKIREIGNILELKMDDNLTNEELGKVVAEGYIHLRDEVLGMRRFAEFNIEPEKIVDLYKDVQNERFAQNTPFELDDNTVKNILSYYGKEGI
ncbi:iron-containing alcohol dehydrogenase [Holdemanella biformis]|uniref:iron-containing alcohol dehydrogenase n=1 Tax=Holdemanella biformis TaxID=1735 RepID=UPI0022E6AA3E|nr:iron-containing alcohol dehydrogenase [Holdemanella biformis]